MGTELIGDTVAQWSMSWTDNHEVLISDLDYRSADLWVLLANYPVHSMNK